MKRRRSTGNRRQSHVSTRSRNLTQWHESGSVVTGLTVSNWSVSDGEFTQVVTNHLWSDVNLVERLTVVNTDDGTDHLWNNNHVSQVGLDEGWLLVWLLGQLSGSQLSDQDHWLVVQTTAESSSDSSVGQLGEFLGFQGDQFLQVNTSEGEGLKDSLLSGFGYKMLVNPFNW
ncbi:hypothetical protein BABINDRAFT_162918 [Babjeviella inositovora NRRL Y-12698]|uniref:Uncharacterized protein n=1 Tax=Babjeviella inositovora NRRL Y-12698 TaxID=984486 RepID=A0A1E3QLB9_9ASCO|nr:uncharacterized protein BABINDRAFT_162918 [Babjeviella inositovora NRRL Y-12698]ODQ78264.1 hypothetical protein BABINDRAFT_162918 [Babjeviella inositovora NRRL Y-12698]